MGKCYCDYCDVFLTHDSVAVRKQHNDGNRHKQNVCDYYRQFVGQKTQRLIDAVVAAFERRLLAGLVVPTYGQPSLNGAAPVLDDAPPPAVGGMAGAAMQPAGGMPAAATGGQFGAGDPRFGPAMHPAQFPQAPGVNGDAGASIPPAQQKLPPS